MEENEKDIITEEKEKIVEAIDTIAPEEAGKIKPEDIEFEPVYYTIKELEALYKKHKIAYKDLMLYKNRPDKIPVKGVIPVLKKKEEDEIKAEESKEE